jgi:hypothetical protein
MPLAKITFAGVTIALGGWAVLIGIPFMFSVLYSFINSLLSGILFITGIIILALFVASFLKGR